MMAACCGSSRRTDSPAVHDRTAISLRQFLNIRLDAGRITRKVAIGSDREVDYISGVQRDASAPSRIVLH